MVNSPLAEKLVALPLSTRRALLPVAHLIGQSLQEVQAVSAAHARSAPALEPVIERLNSVLAVLTEGIPPIKCQFLPQAWIGDWATPVDPEGPLTWEVPRHWIDGPVPGSACDEADMLREHPNTPAWIRDWSGPFEVYITNSQDFENEPTPGSQWESDVQFARLLAEINATQDNLDLRALALSMDLGTDQIHELFDRADQVWEEHKARGRGEEARAGGEESLGAPRP